MIHLRLEEEHLPLEDLAVFFDWCSLFQKPRTEEIEEIFKRSLKAVNLWYAHVMVMCWLLTRVPEGVLAYERRGWPTFEQGVSCFIKDGSKVLDLGAMDDTCTTWWSALKSCKAGRLPPMAPPRFVAVLDEKKSFLVLFTVRARAAAQRPRAHPRLKPTGACLCRRHAARPAPSLRPASACSPIRTLARPISWLHLSTPRRRGASRRTAARCCGTTT